MNGWRWPERFYRYFEINKTMELENIINTVVEKRVEELIQQALHGKSYRTVESYIEDQISKITREAFASRESELREKITALVRDTDLSRLKVDCYAKIEPNKEQF